MNVLISCLLWNAIHIYSPCSVFIMKMRIDDGDDDCTEKKKLNARGFWPWFSSRCIAMASLKWGFTLSTPFNPHPLLTPKIKSPLHGEKKLFTSLRESFKSQLRMAMKETLFTQKRIEWHHFHNILFCFLFVFVYFSFAAQKQRK